MKLQTLEDLLIHQCQDILSAEHQAKKALPRMAEAAGSDKLRKAFRDHQKETDAQDREDLGLDHSDPWN